MKDWSKNIPNRLSTITVLGGVRIRLHPTRAFYLPCRGHLDRQLHGLHHHSGEDVRTKTWANMIKFTYFDRLVPSNVDPPSITQHRTASAKGIGDDVHCSVSVRFGVVLYSMITRQMSASIDTLEQTCLSPMLDAEIDVSLGLEV